MMLKLNKHFKEVKKRCMQRGSVLLLFDFDGTLSPIVAHPDMARLIPGWRERLKRLKKNSKITLGIVTGRDIKSIRKRIGIPGVIIASDHGCEVWRGTRIGVRYVGKNSRYLKDLEREAKEEFGDISGIVVEKKRYSMAIHYRMVDSCIKTSVKKGADKLADKYCDLYGWNKMHGKELIEIRLPDSWHKGDAVKWIKKNYASKAIPVYVGDDTTDEDAFRAIGKRGITIRVGRKKGSAASYYVDSVEDMVPWLDRMVEEL